MLVPDGDRRHCPKSGGVIYKEHISIWDDHVMRKLILGHYLCNELRMYISFRLRRSPREYLIQPGMLIDFGSNRFEFCFR